MSIPIVLRWWWAIIAASVTVGATFGWLFGAFVRLVMLDHVVFVNEFVSIGSRAGLLLGTIFGACIVLNRACPSVRGAVRLGVALVVAFVTCTAVFAIVAVGATKLHILRYQAEVHANRVAFVEGMNVGAIAGWAVIVVMGTSLLQVHKWRPHAHVAGGEGPR